MSYSSFTIPLLKSKFNLKIEENENLFSDCPPNKISNWLKESLEHGTAVALSNNTEKARSEMIIAPIMLELWYNHKQSLSLFSGVDFNVADEFGLTGVCDFLISKNPERLVITSPVFILVEAKKENINAGIPQCFAEMIAAQIFNQQEGN